MIHAPKGVADALSEGRILEQVQVQPGKDGA